MGRGQTRLSGSEGEAGEGVRTLETERPHPASLARPTSPHGRGAQAAGAPPRNDAEGGPVSQPLKPTYTSRPTKPLLAAQDARTEMTPAGMGEPVRRLRHAAASTSSRTRTTARIFYTDVGCRLFDEQTCRCRDYANRTAHGEGLPATHAAQRRAGSPGCRRPAAIGWSRKARTCTGGTRSSPATRRPCTPAGMSVRGRMSGTEDDDAGRGAGGSPV